MSDILQKKSEIQELKQQLEELKELNRQTEKLSKIGSYKIYLENGLVEWTEGLFDIFNFPYNAKLPAPDEYYKYVHPEDRHEVQKMFTDCVEKNAPFDLVYRIILNDGTRKTIDSKSKVVYNNSGERILFGFLRDITIEINTSKKLQESETKFRLFFDSLQEGVALNKAIYNEKGDIVDYEIQMVNKAFYKHSSYKPEEAIGKRATDIYKMSSEYITEWWSSNKNTTYPVHTELFDAENDKWNYISTSEMIADYFVTAFFDISEIKQKEIALEESEKKYKNLIENIPLGVIVFTNEKIVFANSAMKKMVEIDEQQNIRQHSFFDFIAMDERRRFEIALQNSYNNPDFKSRLFHFPLLINKESKDCEILLTSYRENGKFLWKCIVTDKTNKYDMQRKAKRISTDAVYLSQKMTLFSEIDQELNTIISGYKLDNKLFENLRKKLYDNRELEQIWQVFHGNFEILYEDFFSRLLQLAPTLTQQELKHCALIKLNFETKEIAALFNVKPTTIQIGRVRIKKKLGLQPEQELINYIITL